MKKILCIIGKSCSGKSTLIKELCVQHGFHYVKSKTTRAEREDDPEDHLTHIFSSPEEFESDLKDGRVIATYVSPNGYINWTSEDLFSDDTVNVYAIDIIAFTELCQSSKGKYQIYGIYLDVSDKERQKRMKKRKQEYDNEPHLDKRYFRISRLNPNYYDVICADGKPKDVLELANQLLISEGFINGQSETH